MGTCKSCKYWGVAPPGEPESRREYYNDDISAPYDPDTYKPMELPFKVLRCGHPELRFCERPLEPNGFAVVDGSEYFAAFYTAEDFGCIRHEPKTPPSGGSV